MTTRLLLLFLLASACSTELPAFANPPDPPDAGAEDDDGGRD